MSNDELVTVRDAMRGLNRMTEQLQSGEREQFVLMHRGRMVARIVPVGVTPDKPMDTPIPGEAQRRFAGGTPIPGEAHRG